MCALFHTIDELPIDVKSCVERGRALELGRVEGVGEYARHTFEQSLLVLVRFLKGFLAVKLLYNEQLLREIEVVRQDERIMERTQPTSLYAHPLNRSKPYGPFARRYLVFHV